MPLAVEVYEKLRTKIGEEEAALLVQFVEETIDKGAATKQDVLAVKHALEQRDSSLEQRITEVEHSLGQRITEVEHSLERRIDRTFYILLAALLILNGDKVLGFLSSLLGLFR